MGAGHQHSIASLELCPNTCRVRDTVRLKLGNTSHAETSSGHLYGRITKFYCCCISHTKLLLKTYLRQSEQTRKK